MNTQGDIPSASGHLQTLTGYMFDALTISRPRTVGEAVNLAKVISKLSPLVGNLIEFNTVEFLNTRPEYEPFGKWVRKEPFPIGLILTSPRRTESRIVKLRASSRRC